jgi:hypothetical protein
MMIKQIAQIILDNLLSGKKGMALSTLIWIILGVILIAAAITFIMLLNSDSNFFANTFFGGG